MDRIRNQIAALTVAALLLAPANFMAQENENSLATKYREPAGRIIGAALTDDGGWEKLTVLTTSIGNRLSGSASLERAVKWAAERMKAEGLDNVQLLPVKVPHWVRGRESASVISPIEKHLNILGLGNSVGTPPEGVTASVVVVHNFDELDKLPKDRVAGKIVVYSVPWEGYGRTVQYRSRGPSRAAKLGAVAVLTRSATGRSLYTPHTGALDYAEDAPKIPAAALTVEDVQWIDRTVTSGVDVKVHLQMEAKMLPDADSANVIGEVTGREKPEEIIVLGGHVDSWDVGQGANDDGSGIIATWQAVTLLKQLGLRPRRTVRVVLWTNEENGLRGGEEYRKWVGDKIGNYVAGIEMDGGAEKPIGFGFSVGGARPARGAGGPAGGVDIAALVGGGRGAAQAPPNPVEDAALAKLQQIGELLRGIEAGEITRGGGGADIGPLSRDGMPSLGMRTVGEHYFDWHHTNADTLDKVDKQEFRKCVAAIAVLAYILAEMPERIVPAPAK